MHYLFIVLIFCVIIFLYCLYLLTEDDFVIMRKNVSVERIFNITIIMLFISLFSSRLFYVFLNPRSVFFEPLGFIMFPYFPGLSLTGGIIGALLFFGIYSRRSNLPSGRIFDFLAASFIYTAPFGAAGIMLVSLNFGLNYVFLLVFYSLLASVSIFYFRKVAKNFKDGSYGLVAAILTFVSILIFNASNSMLGMKFIIQKENIIVVAAIIVFILLLIKNEGGRVFKRNER